MQYSTEVFVSALVTSRIDYCNAIPAVIPNKFIHHSPQLIQNSAAGIITCSKYREHVTPHLTQFHWLPVSQWIFFFFIYTFINSHNLSPAYVTDLLQTYTPSRSLRSFTINPLALPAINFNKIGARAFFCAAPKLWTSLPLHIRILDRIQNCS